MSNVENVCPQVLRGLARELRRLAADPPAGIKLLLRDDDLTDVVALIEGPAGTPYAGGVFRVRVVLGREFPASPPRAYFLTRIFHPNVSPASGEVCVNTLSREWRPELGLGHALLAVRCLLIAPNADSALNADAAALLRHRYDDYFARAKLLADIHARPKDVEADSAGTTEDGPCAKRERRPATGAAGTEPGQTGPGAGQPGPAAGHAGPTAERAGPAAGHAGPAAGRAGPAAGHAGPARPAPSKDKDRRRILKRL